MQQSVADTTTPPPNERKEVPSPKIARQSSGSARNHRQKLTRSPAIHESDVRPNSLVSGGPHAKGEHNDVNLATALSELKSTMVSLQEALTRTEARLKRVRLPVKREVSPTQIPPGSPGASIQMDLTDSP
ncbi:hypothetical protein NLI96_g83 [Meripilus lineatus]|uniref:Uncharacterized protein n=1 Tax=Meripilus lineatus TaxID=2056292 RepID=A0AAD5VIR9_9APHY|nr:hypothetical protein NLI96_g83 [Physisporinus lineatus]